MRLIDKLMIYLIQLASRPGYCDLPGGFESPSPALDENPENEIEIITALFEKFFEHSDLLSSPSILVSNGVYIARLSVPVFLVSR